MKKLLPPLLFLLLTSCSPMTELDGLSYTGANGQELPYLRAHSIDEPAGIFVYMHGAGGDYTQGMSDEDFSGNFLNLAWHLEDIDYLYVTPETRDFNSKGGADLNAFGQELKELYGDLPIILSGASAGGRAIYYALQDEDHVFDEAVFLVPAVNEVLLNKDLPKIIPITIAYGTEDNVVSAELLEKWATKLKAGGYTVDLIPFEGGGHNTPLELINWAEVVE